MVDKDGVMLRTLELRFVPSREVIKEPAGFKWKTCNCN